MPEEVNPSHFMNSEQVIFKEKDSRKVKCVLILHTHRPWHSWAIRRSTFFFFNMVWKRDQQHSRGTQTWEDLDTSRPKGF